MAELNPNLILQSQVPNFGETYANALLAGSQIAERRGNAEKEQAAMQRAEKFNALTAAIPDGVNRRDYLTKQGFGAEALELDKAQGEADKSMGEGSEKLRQTAGKMFQFILAHPNPTKDVVAQVLEEYRGEIPATMYLQAKAGMANMPDKPDEIRALAKARVDSLMQPKEQMGFIQPDADSQLSAQTQMRGQDITSQNNLANQGLNQQEFGLKQSGQQFDEQYKGAQFGLDQKKYGLDEWKSKNPQGAITPSQRRMDADAVISILNQAEPLLGGSTSSLVGTGVDAAAGAFGYSMPGAQNAAQLKALEGALISKMPKMSGPQSDKDVLLYKQMAGQIGDSTLPIATRKAAMETIRTLNEQYASPESVGHGASGSWTPDDHRVVEKANKHGLTPEQYLDALKKNGLMQ